MKKELFYKFSRATIAAFWYMLLMGIQGEMFRVFGMPLLTLGGGIPEEAQAKLNGIDRCFFIENKGQWPKDVLYLCRMGGLDAWITKYGVNYTFYKIEGKEGDDKKERGVRRGKFDREDLANNIVLGHRVLFELEGRQPNVAGEGMQQQGYYNYFIGNDPSKHATNVGLYKEAIVREVYPGIDLRYYFDRGYLRYDFVVHAGAEPSQIKIRLRGQDSDEIRDGRIVFSTRFGEVQMAELQSYQGTSRVLSHFEKEGKGCYRIAVGEYDRSRPLVIDPLVYSTYIGGSDDDVGYGIALDGSGNAYVTGFTNSPDYDTTSGAFQMAKDDYRDVFVTKLNAAGTQLVYSTYIGGNDDDKGFGIALDGSGNAYVTGYTYSPDYDITSGAFQTANEGDLMSRPKKSLHFFLVNPDTNLHQVFNPKITLQLYFTFTDDSGSEQC